MLEKVSVDSVVIGAGVVGLACARALSNAGREVWLLEQHDLVGSETSSRNSEVIHAGIYYPAHSLKARLCVRGKALLYDYLSLRNIPHKRCGKLIVATNESQLSELSRIDQRARDNGVVDLCHLSQSELFQLEPELNAEGALFSPSTGILDSHAYMNALQKDSEDAGCVVLFKQTVLKMSDCSDGIELLIQEASGNQYVVHARTVIAAMGLSGYQWLADSECYPKECLRPLYYARGNYYALQAKSPFQHLVYPVPEPGGLGIHLTHDMSGAARFGPDVEWIETIDYSVSNHRELAFYEAIRKYWPKLPDGSLSPSYSGIRPKLSPDGGVFEDFCIQDEKQHGIPGFINLTGIESPGLTASLAIAEEIMKHLSAV